MEESAKIAAAGAGLTYYIPCLQLYDKRLTFDIAKHSYQLGEIPYLWETSDNQRTYDNTVIRKFSNAGDLPIGLQAESNYIKLNLNSSNEGETMRLVFYTDEDIPLVHYEFNTKFGAHTYLIRTSSNMFWGDEAIQKYKLIKDGGGDIQLLGAWLIAGD